MMKWNAWRISAGLSRMTGRRAPCTEPAASMFASAAVDSSDRRHQRLHTLGVVYTMIAHTRKLDILHVCTKDENCSE